MLSRLVIFILVSLWLRRLQGKMKLRLKATSLFLALPIKWHRVLLFFSFSWNWALFSYRLTAWSSVPVFLDLLSFFFALNKKTLFELKIRWHLIFAFRVWLANGARVSWCCLQDKIQSLAGQHSDLLENLTPKVRRRVEVLKEIQARLCLYFFRRML